jgi:glycerol-3-phosphate dehydrogenase (NAD(P)+)
VNDAREQTIGGPVAVVGGGAWGTALAIHLARLEVPVRMWIREQELVTRLRTRHDNPLYLPGVAIPSQVVAYEKLAPAVEGAGLVLLAVPSQFARPIYRELARVVPATVPVVVACKGIERQTLALPLEVAADELGDEHALGVVSGPSFAVEVAEGRPTAIVAAAVDDALAESLQHRFSSPTLRMYRNTDPVGVQLAGALKNVIAIAVGIAESLEMGTNARAALITRGLVEMTRLGVAIGGRHATFSGLAGLGDLVLTCTGELSRNRKLGMRIGHGERLEDILAVSRSVAEGVETARSAHALAARSGVEMPIVEEVCRVLYEDASPHRSLERLMSRPLSAEHEWSP